ncbi:MAG: leucyl aminopeptidase, partial [Rhodobacteraceae bacterium]|nr:leucyl aminopeptidase [Paracoccaceae bacterium]
MTRPAEIAFLETDLEALPATTGRIVAFAAPDGRLDAGARRLNRLTRGAIARLVASPAFATARDGDGFDLAYPAGLAAEAVQVVRLPRRADVATARRAGATIAAACGEAAVLVLAGGLTRPAEVAYGLALRGYDFATHRTAEAKPAGAVRFMLANPEAAAAVAAPMAAVAEGVFFTRDLVNEPANVLTTTDFADRLLAMQEIGLEVEVLDEDQLAKLGMRALLAVGQGSESPTKVVVMRWNGGAGEAPLALVGKGVVFDTGGISIKPGAGMEEMTMDMGGAGVVAGVMRT